MVYPSRPEAPTTSGWLQMIETEVSFLSWTNRSSGTLVGSADATRNVSIRKQLRADLFIVSVVKKNEKEDKSDASSGVRSEETFTFGWRRWRCRLFWCRRFGGFSAFS